MTVDMNNPTCGDRIRLTFDIHDGILMMQSSKEKVAQFLCQVHQ